MASGRPDTFGGGGGGGYLNGKTATITGYAFVIGDSVTETAYGPFTPLSLVLSFKTDSATAVETRRMLVGNAKKIAKGISPDGQTLHLADGARISKDQEAAVFLASVFAKDADADSYPDVDGEANYAPLIGKRVLFAMIQTARKKNTEVGKDGKTYPVRDLLVDAVYGSVANGANGGGLANQNQAATKGSTNPAAAALLAKITAAQTVNA